MIFACLDFESYFDADFTLSKLTTEQYIRDPRFEALGMALIIPSLNIKTYVVPEALPNCFEWLKDKEVTLLCHHAHFDGLIASHHFNYRPQFWLDTLSMGRQIHGNGLRLGLGSLAEHYGLSPKSVPYDLFKGRRWADLDTVTRQELAAGAIHDAELTVEICSRMLKQFPPPELEIIDTTIRMFTEPALVGDQALFEKIANDAWTRKNELLAELGVGEADLQSAAKFAALIEAQGIAVEMKRGKDNPDGSEKWIPAVAKTDSFMRELVDDFDERVAGLAQARLEVRSTINETRAGRLSAMSSRGPLCIYLPYCGAHTTRWSGGDSINFQNLPRGQGLRQGVRAPQNFRLACPDQSQGECRILNWLAGQNDVVERFRLGHDPYIPIASKFYDFEVTKDHPTHRGLGKLLELSCGYMASGPTIKATAAKGQYGPPVFLSDDESERAKLLYRHDHKMVVKLWRYGGDFILPTLLNGQTTAWGPLEIHDHRVFLPSGGWIDYTGLAWEDGEWRVKTRSGYKKMYGAKLVENVVQALSRCVTSDAMKVYRAMGYRIVGMAHDDVWLLVPDDDKPDWHERRIAEVMAATPEWAPGLPLACECKLKGSYGG